MILTALLMATLAAPAPRSLSQERPNLDGTWRMVEHNADGRGAVPAAELTWVISGEQLTVRRDGLSVSGVRDDFGLVIPSRGGANALDYVVPYDDGRRHTYLGWCELRGDKLTLCITLKGDRPSDTEATKGRVVYILARARDTK